MVAYKPYEFNYDHPYYPPGPEYGVRYFKKADRQTPYEHTERKWIRIHNLPDARKKAMWLISHGNVIEARQQWNLPKGTFFVELFKDGGEGRNNKDAGIVVRVHGKYYWKGLNGGYHILNKDGSIETKAVIVPGMPQYKKAYRRF